MKQNLRLIFMTLLCAVFSMAWGEEVVYKTLTFSSETNSQGVSSYESEWYATIDDFAWTINNFNNNNNQWNFIRCGRKNSDSTGKITTSSTIDKAITKVVVTIDALTNLNNSTLEVASNTNFTGDVQTIEVNPTSSGVVTYTVPNPTTNQYYRLSYACASGSNGAVQISKVEYYYDNGAASQIDIATLNSISPTQLNIDDEGTFALDASFVEGLVADVDYEVTWASDNTEVLGVDVESGEYLAYTAGTAKITVTVNALDDETYNDVCRQFVVTVTDPNAAGTEANPYTVAQALEVISTLADNGKTPNSVYVKGTVSNVDDVNTEYGNATYYISDDDANNELYVYRGKYLDNENFTSTSQINKGDAVVILGQLQKYVKNDAVTPEIAAGNYLVSITPSTPPVDKKDVTMSFNPAEVTITEGETFTAPTLTTEPAGLTVTYTSKNENVATVDAETGAVEIVGVGTATITASFAGNEEYNPGEASYKLTVNKAPVINNDPDAIVFADSELNLENSVAYTEPFENKNETFTVTFGGGGNNGKYYTTGEGIRVYGDGTMTIEAVKDKKLVKIEISYDGDNKPESADVVDVPTYNPETGVWEGSSNKVVFTRPSGSGHWRVQKVKVYVEDDTTPEKEDVTMSFNPAEVTITEGETFTAPTLTTEPAGLTVTYTSKNENVATVDAETGAVEIVGVGTATITASFAGNEEYNPGEASYKLTVNKAPVINNDPDAIVFADSELNLENSVAYTEPFENKNETFTVTFGGGGNNGKYYTTGEGIRVYGDGTMTIEAVKDKKLVKIEISYDGDNKPESADVVDVPTYNPETGVWEGSSNKVVFTRPSGSGHWRVQKVKVYVEDATETVTISEVGYSTLYYGTENLVVPEGVTAYTYMADGDKIAVSKTYDEGDVIPAGTGVVLKGNEGTYNFIVTSDTGEGDENSDLYGLDEAGETTAPGEGSYFYYKLSLASSTADKSTVGFYFGAEGGGQFTLPAHRAYLAIPQGRNGVSAFVFDETVGISQIKNVASDDSIYTILGVKVSKNKLNKGIYIVNGKKMVIK